MAKRIDWDAEAVAMADYVVERMFSAHRGVMPWRQTGVAVIFGNDGYGGSYENPDGDPRVKKEVELVREALAGLGIDVFGFGVESAEDHYSWAMLVRSDDLGRLNSIAWQSWEVACGVRSEIDPNLELVGGVQPGIAWKTIAEAGIRPDHSAN
jgi:hypothetical protein